MEVVGFGLGIQEARTLHIITLLTMIRLITEAVILAAHTTETAAVLTVVEVATAVEVVEMEGDIDEDPSA